MTALILLALAIIIAHLHHLTRKTTRMSSKLDILTAGMAAIDATTSEIAGILAAEGPKLDAIVADIAALKDVNNIPQPVLDAMDRIKANADAIRGTLTAQSARLDVIATDASNPVPEPAPATEGSK